MYGKETLAIVSKQVAESGEWKRVPKEEMDEMKAAVLLERQERIVRMSDTAIGREIDKVMSKVEAEVRSVPFFTAVET